MRGEITEYEHFPNVISSLRGRPLKCSKVITDLATSSAEKRSDKKLCWTIDYHLLNLGRVISTCATYSAANDAGK